GPALVVEHPRAAALGHLRDRGKRPGRRFARGRRGEREFLAAPQPDLARIGAENPENVGEHEPRERRLVEDRPDALAQAVHEGHLLVALEDLATQALDVRVLWVRALRGHRARRVRSSPPGIELGPEIVHGTRFPRGAIRAPIRREAIYSP